jgi:hypothetical protein
MRHQNHLDRRLLLQMMLLVKNLHMKTVNHNHLFHLVLKRLKYLSFHPNRRGVMKLFRQHHRHQQLLQR